MPVPLPKTGRENLAPPDAAEVEVLSRGVLAAIRPVGGHTDVQKLLASSLFLSMTGHPATFGGAPLGPGEFAEALAARNAAFRGRIVQIMVLLALVLRPLPPEVARRVAAYSAEMGVDEEMIRIAQRFADGSLGLAAVDFERNGYAAGWDAASATALHTARKLDTAWDLDVADPELAARWEALEKLPEGTLGRRVTEFYRARGFTYPGRPGSAPPLLAQHDWVHLVADYGTTVESELEVFAFIARANDDPRAFSLLAMVVSLFETGYLRSGAGLFEASQATCPSPEWLIGWPTRCAEEPSAAGRSISWPSTGSNWPTWTSTRSGATSACLKRARTRKPPDQSVPGIRAASAPSRSAPGAFSPTSSASPMNRSGPRLLCLEAEPLRATKLCSGRTAISTIVATDGHHGITVSRGQRAAHRRVFSS